MTVFRKISIITPCYNSKELIKETIQSILSNSVIHNGLLELEYIICDGGSSDGTVEEVEKIFSKINDTHIKKIIISERDNGMYDALSKGLKKATGNIVSYINAGDYYSPYAFEIVYDLFERYKIKWLTGLDISYNNKSQIIFSRLPFRYRRNLIKCGFYNNELLPHIQQESTFWCNELNSLIKHEELRSLKYAGDFYLWKTFSQKEELYIVESWLGGFKYHPNQLTSNMKYYNAEMKKISKKPNFYDFFQAYTDKFYWNLSEYYKKKYNNKTLIYYSHTDQKFILP